LKKIAMTISHDDVERILKLLEASHFDELLLETDGLKLDLRRGGRREAPAFQPATRMAPAAGAPAIAQQSPAGPETVHASPVLQSGLHEVKSPMLGTFYRSPKPGAEPFVKVGGRVEPDTVVGIVEVMKLMNSVAAGVRGEVVEVAGADAALVEFDQVLVRVRVD
jgi:acetyl-CoA carboxylase biotin carboxyl carrier protein